MPSRGWSVKPDHLRLNKMNRRSFISNLAKCGLLLALPIRETRFEGTFEDLEIQRNSVSEWVWIFKNREINKTLVIQHPLSDEFWTYSKCSIFERSVFGDRKVKDFFFTFNIPRVDVHVFGPLEPISDRRLSPPTLNLSYSYV